MSKDKMLYDVTLHLDEDTIRRMALRRTRPKKRELFADRLVADACGKLVDEWISAADASRLGQPAAPEPEPAPDYFGEQGEHPNYRKPDPVPVPAEPDYETLADEAEQGYDVSHLVGKPNRVRPAEPERPELSWDLGWELFTAMDPDHQYRMKLAGHLKVGDIILWGTGKWEPIGRIDGVAYFLGNLVQRIPPAVPVVVKVDE